MSSRAGWELGWTRVPTHLLTCWPPQRTETLSRLTSSTATSRGRMKSEALWR